MKNKTTTSNKRMIGENRIILGSTEIDYEDSMGAIGSFFVDFHEKLQEAGKE